MDLPDFIASLPELDVPFPADVVATHVFPSEHGLVVFFEFFKDMELPMHSHKAQWGTVLEGSVTLTIGGDTREYRAGDTYNIASGVEHGGIITAGTKAIDIFEEADRYPIKAS
ncbi:MAG: cupin domain-containing protein [Rhodobacteraceae bacterium]|nr:cupin domain-containing protein [Paracoccaceae bacterium]